MAQEDLDATTMAVQSKACAPWNPVNPFGRFGFSKARSWNWNFTPTSRKQSNRKRQVFC